MRFESPSSFFYLLCCEDTGDYLCVDAAADAATGALALRLDGRAVDGAMWAREELEGGLLRLTAATAACTLLLSRPLMPRRRAAASAASAAPPRSSTPTVRLLPSATAARSLG